MKSEDVEKAYAHSFTFLEATGDVVMAWMLLWRASVASEKLDKAKKKDVDYYEGVVKTAEFFIHNTIPLSIGKMETILNCNDSALEISENCFGG